MSTRKYEIFHKKSCSRRVGCILAWGKELEFHMDEWSVQIKRVGLCYPTRQISYFSLWLPGNPYFLYPFFFDISYLSPLNTPENPFSGFTPFELLYYGCAFFLALLVLYLLSCDEDGLGYRTTSSYVLSKNPRIFPIGVCTERIGNAVTPLALCTCSGPSSTSRDERSTN